jgi:hypothetical protein
MLEQEVHCGLIELERSDYNHTRMTMSMFSAEQSCPILKSL